MTRSRYRIVVEGEAVVDMAGTRQTFLFGVEDWCTRPSDTPPNTGVPGLLRSAGRFERSLFRGNGITGRITSDAGYISLRNQRPRELGGAGELDAWAGYSVSGCRWVVRRGLVEAAYPGGYDVLFVAVGLNATLGDELVIRLRDDGMLLDQPVVTDGFRATGGLEGSAPLPKRKQFCSEVPGFFEPICIDPVRRVYYVHSCSTQGLHDAYLTAFPGDPVYLFAVYVKGVLQTREGPNYESEGELLGTSPGADGVRFWFGPVSTYLSSWRTGPVYFRLGSDASPSDVRVFAIGGPTDADHARRGVPLGSFFASHLALRAGIPLERIDVSADVLTVGEQLIDDDRTYADALTDSAQALQGWYGFDRLGMFRSGYLRDVSADASIHTFTSADVLLGSVRREPVSGFDAPLWSFSFACGDTWPCQTDDSADPVVREYLSRSVWAAASGVDASTKIADPGAGHLSITTRGKYLDDAAGMSLMLERMALLYAGRHHFWTWSVLIDDQLPLETLELDLVDVVTLEFPHIGLAGGIDVRIVSMTIDLSSPTHKIIFVGWGGTPGALTTGEGGTPSSVDPAGAVALIDDFSGIMYGSIASGGTSGSSDIVDDFTGYIVGTVIADPYFSSVVLLMHCESDSPWIDSSSYAATLTSSGTITASSSGALVGTKSMQAGASGYVGTPSHARYNMGSGDVTVECTLRLASTPNFERPLLIGGNGIELWFQATTTALSVIAFGAVACTSSALSLSTTYHIAVVKQGTTYTIYANGTSVGSGTRAGSDDGTSARQMVVGSSTGAQEFTSGKIDEIRITKGVARYTATFTPPSTPYPGL